jgi:predicted LPLAT superfamily acyltransferase/outer membrane lipoprotein-sorting protein
LNKERNAPPSEGADWKRRPERSNMFWLRLMTWISLTLGRGPSRVVLFGIAAYFLAFAPTSRVYLQRALRPGSLADVGWRHLFRHFLSFASVIHDRVYLINDRHDLFDIRIHNQALIDDLVAQGRGAFLIGAHLGSFEVLRAVGRRQPGLRIAMAMYEDNARKINAALTAINPNAQQGIVALGHIDSMMQVHELLAQGTVVGMLGDRSLGNDDTRQVDFLGGEAALPLGPFRMAAIMKRPVLFMTGLFRGGAAGPDAGGASRHDALCCAARAVLPRGALQLVQFLRLLARPRFPRRETFPRKPMTHTAKPSTPATTRELALGGLMPRWVSVLAMLATGLALMASSPSALAAWDLQQLMDSLAQNKSGRATFVETKQIAVLDKPVESSGELLFTAPDRLEKRTLRPKPESMVVNGDELSVERAGRKYQLQLQAYPELAAFIDSIRGTLAGDRQALERNYRLSLGGSADRWDLQLLPLDEKMKAVIRRIRISGARDQVSSIEINQADGDSSLMVIEKSTTAR